jgi:hypothetical protein
VAEEAAALAAAMGSSDGAGAGAGAGGAAPPPPPPPPPDEMSIMFDVLMSQIPTPQRKVGLSLDILAEWEQVTQTQQRRKESPRVCLFSLAC